MNNALLNKYQVNIPIQLKKLKSEAKIPAFGSDYAAGCDLSACIDKPVYIKPGATVKIGTGLAIACPINYWTAIFARSGLATKQGLRPANCVGVIDPDYRGEIIVALHNDSEKTWIIQPGDRIAQLVLMPRYAFHFDEVEELKESKRGTGGFGSTGK